jgi:hypothetical protein
MPFPHRIKSLFLLTLAAFLLTGCPHQKPPPEALQLSSESLKERQMQTRRFETEDEAKILSASASVLQDLGFNIDESETDLGVIVCSKKRDATSGGQVAGAVALAILFGAVVHVDKTQIIRASLVTRPIGRKTTAVRVTFQRVIINTANQVTRAEPIIEEKIYQEFFDKLSQSIFLEAHQL